MLKKITSNSQKIFFAATFFALYTLFVVHFVRTVVIGAVDMFEMDYSIMMLPFVWLMLMTARYLYKKGGEPKSANSGSNHHRHYRR